MHSPFANRNLGDFDCPSGIGPASGRSRRPAEADAPGNAALCRPDSTACGRPRSQGSSNTHGFEILLQRLDFPRCCARGRAHSGTVTSAMPGRGPFARSIGGSGGFSVLEIMVAVALLAVIIVGLLAMFYQVQRAFRAGTAQVDVMEGGRATMNLLTRDLQEMTATGLPLVTNCVILDSSGINPASPRTSVQEFGSGAVRENYQQDICFLSRLNDEWIGTAYRVAFADTGAGTLYRLNVRRPIESLPLNNANVMTQLSFFACTNLDFDGPELHRVLDGVVHLTFTPYDRNGFPYTERSIYNDNDPTLAKAYANNIRIEHDKGIYAFLTNGLPAFVDIELAVLEPSVFEKFNARVDSALPYPQSINRATNYLARQIGRTHVFRQRVAIRPAATDIGARLGQVSP